MIVLNIVKMYVVQKVPRRYKYNRGKYYIKKDLQDIIKKDNIYLSQN